ncbi:hypothetical protein D046_9103, partial [Vibrio parahaemolyticus V-223/04]
MVSPLTRYLTLTEFAMLSTTGSGSLSKGSIL